jgi:hypothetical protein
MLDIDAISKLHRAMVVHWHSNPIDNPYRDFLSLVCQQFSFNFQLWHEEDIARSLEVSDAEIARVKRSIDRFNQQRNDAIEKLDDWITERLAELNIAAAEQAPLNTETLGSVIDRLSILALRIYHLEEQTQRTDATAEHVASVERKLAIALVQQDDLTQSLRELATDIFAGRKRHKTYRQMKMYNDPALNPYLYQARQRSSARTTP